MLSTACYLVASRLSAAGDPQTSQVDQGPPQTWPLGLVGKTFRTSMGHPNSNPQGPQKTFVPS